jgi:Cu(I)/Ag(I) efflux system membrane fusion protein
MESGPPAPPGAGSQAVYISPARQQLVGVRSAPIGRQRVEGSVRTVGRLAYDETRTAQIHTRVSGWVEQLYVDYVGKPVRRGQPLFAVYSPDLATAQADYLVARNARQKLADNANGDLRAGADALLQASRDRMRRWSVTDEQIAELERTGQASRTVAIASPFDGVVVEKDAIAGQYVTPEMTAFKLADLSAIWAIGQVFEYEAARLHIGDAVEVEFPYGQAAKRTAKIDFIYPDVDPQTRRVRFRATLDNRDHMLKPDTYVNVVWHGESIDRLVIPKEAVIDTGPRKYALLALANGYFESRDVQIGPAIGEFYPVISGVAEGDRVVTSAQFLVDSETNLMAAMQGMAMAMPGMDMPGMDMSQPGAMDHAHHAGSASAGGGGSAASMPAMPGM